MKQVLALHRMRKKNKLFHNKTKQYLIQTDIKPRRFFILPQVHEPVNPGPPIVHFIAIRTERRSYFVRYHVHPLVHELPSFVNDTNGFINKLLTIAN